MIKKIDVKELANTYLKKEYALAITVCCIVIVGLFNALRFGLASAEYHQAKDIMETWHVEQKVSSAQSYQEAASAVATAKFLHSSNPLYLDLAGELNEWAAIAGADLSQQDPASSLQTAKEYYLEASKARPLWPVTWANLAMIKWRLQEFDEEMLRYLNQADRLGPQAVEVDLLFIRLGIALYQSNNTFYIPLKERIHNRLRSGIVNERSRSLVLSYIDSTESIEFVCAWMRELEEGLAEEYLTCPLSKIFAS